jgi:hypothetical protein
MLSCRPTSFLPSSLLESPFDHHQHSILLIELRLLLLPVIVMVVVLVVMAGAVSDSGVLWYGVGAAASFILRPLILIFLSYFTLGFRRFLPASTICDTNAPLLLVVEWWSVI